MDTAVRQDQQSQAHQITERDAEVIATYMVDKLVEKLSDERTVKAISEVWARQLDQHIGRTVRRVLWLAVVGVSVVVAVKIDAILLWFRGA